MLNKRDKICIVGTGGTGREVFQIIKENLEKLNINPFEVCFFLVKDNEFNNQKIHGIRTLSESKFNKDIYELVIAVGDPVLKKALYEKFPKSVVYPNIISQHALLSNDVSLGFGVIICQGAVITCDIEIGNHAYININSTISHDCNIGDFFTCSPGVNISGNCTISNQVFIGASSSIKQGVKICNNTVIGMGSVVVRDINQSGTYVGNPLRKLK
tara:strand:- start:1288 stop:1929 length:642 start_codon:yes stop_codon:yes gene_type:complete